MIHTRSLQNRTVFLLLFGAVLLQPSSSMLHAQGYSAKMVAAPSFGQLYARTAAAQSNLISDGFDGPALNSRLWTFVDPLSDATLSTNGNQVLISVPAGVAHDAWTGANNAPRLLQPTNDTDFEIVVKIDSPMTTQYQTSGIMVQESPATYLRFDINSDGSVLRAFAASVFNNVATAQSGFDVIVDSNGVVPLYIAVKRIGSSWQMAWSENDTTWYLAASFNFPIIVNAVGLFAANQGTTPPAFTAAFDFFRTAIPARPTLLAPAPAALNTPIPTLFTWAAFPGAAAYFLQVGTDSTFATGLVYNDSTITDTSKSLASLSPLTRYYWHLAARNGSGGTSAFSGVRSFTTVAPPPPMPVLVFPGNGATDVPQSPQFRWTRAAGALTYHLQVAEDSLFSSAFAANDSSITDTTKAIAGLKNSAPYFWRVKSVGPGGSSAFSAAWKFTTVIAAPGIPVLISPANGVTNQPTSCTFTWTRVADAAQYHLQITQDSLFISGLIVNDSTIVDSSKTVSTLAYGSRYFWRVRAKNAGGGSSFAAPRNLTTLVAAPTLLVPQNGAGGQPLTVNLRWSKVPRASAYRLQLGTDSTFLSGIIKNDSTIVDTFRTISGLVINQRYYWRVSARDAGGSGPFSAVWSFVTATPLPDPFSLISPANNASVSKDSVKFLWQSTQVLVERYSLEYAADSLFVFKIVDSTLTDTTKVVRGLTPGARYYWRVRAKNPGGWGAYTPFWAFAVGTTAVADEKSLPREFGLEQNYPNPFNPSTTITFALPSAGRVRLEVYSLIGERVALLADEVREAGYHHVAFDGALLSSGVYLYRLEVEGGQRVFVRKMVIVK